MLALICLPIISFAQIKFTASVGQTSVQQGTRIKYTLTLEGGNGSITPPAFPGFTFEGGPMTQHSYQNINGRMSSSISYVYYIRAKDIGTHAIGPAKANVNGTTYQSNAIRMTVTKGAPAPKVTGATGEVFGRIFVSKSSPLLGEPLSVTYMLYSRHGSLQLQEIKFGDAAGFWKEDVKMGQTQWDPNTEVINGVRYQKAVLKKEMVIPQKIGALQIGAFTMKCLVGGSWFSRGRTVNATSNSPTVNVKALPTPQPASFSGAVGTYDFSVTTDKTELAVDEAVNVKVVISGTGNLKLIDITELDFPGDFEVYDPKVGENFSVVANGLTGNRTSEYTVIPRHHGDYTLGPIDFTYFDLNSKSYVTKTIDAIELKVKKGKGGEAPGIQNFTRKEVEVLDSDIRFIKEDVGGLQKKGSEFFASFIWFMGLFFPMIALVGFFIFYARYERNKSDVVSTRKRRAGKVAKKHLKVAADAKASGDEKRFYEAIAEALYGYAADKLSIPVSELGREQIGKQLEAVEVTEGTITSTLKLLDDCDMARYAPVAEVTPDSIYQRAEKLINQIEQEAKG